MKSTTIGNENITFAVCNLRLGMHEVRSIDDLYQAILRYLKTCFMQDGTSHKSNSYPNTRMFEVWGDFPTIKRNESEIIITDDRNSPAVNLHGENIVDIVIDGDDFDELLEYYAEKQENELVWKALSRLKNELGEYFRMA
jgi:hypothetical protein